MLSWKRVIGVLAVLAGGAFAAWSAWGQPVTPRDLQMGGKDIVDLDDAYQHALTGDTLPRDSMVKAQNAWPQSTTAANYVGADLVLAGGSGAEFVTVSNVANLAGDTLTIAVLDSNGVIANTGPNIVTEGVGDWNCVGAGLTTAQCACALYTRLLTTTPVANVAPVRTDGTCSDSRVYFAPGPAAAGVELYYLSGGTVGLTATMRSDGRIVIGSAYGISIPAMGTSGGGVQLTAGTSTLSIGSGVTGGGAAGFLYAAVVCDATNTNWCRQSTGDQLRNSFELMWSSTTAYSGTKDTGLKRSAAGILGATNGAGTVNLSLTHGRLNPGGTSVNTSSATAQTIFTVPTGRVAYPMAVLIRDASDTISLAQGGFGFDANCTDFVTGVNMTSLSDGTMYLPVQVASKSSPVVEGPAAGVFCYKASATEAAADTVQVDVYGELL